MFRDGLHTFTRVGNDLRFLVKKVVLSPFDSESLLTERLQCVTHCPESDRRSGQTTISNSPLVYQTLPRP